jgi:hypothetical protein
VPVQVSVEATNDEEYPADATLQHYQLQDIALHSSEQQAKSLTKLETTTNRGNARAFHLQQGYVKLTR